MADLFDEALIKSKENEDVSIPTAAELKKAEVEIRERILKALKVNGLAFSRLAKGNTGTQSQLQRQLKAGAALSCNTLLRVLTALPELNANWLLNGEGAMNKNSGAVAHVSKPYNKVNETGGTTIDGDSNDLLKQQMAINARLLALLEEKLK